MNLLDFLQAASNTAAENVSAPVDGLAWLLKKAGVPVGEAPVGGSAWMRGKGLTRPVNQSPASLAGETFGLLSPIVASAKAPQIAGGLLKMADNAMTPRTMNPQTGAIVWHGSPHKFDKFDSSKIGTGEGAQAYGHGLYLAESPDVAQSYRAAVSAEKGRAFGLDDGPTKGIATLIAARGDEGEALARKAYASLGDKLEPTIAAARQAVDGGSSLYKVDLPDEAIAKMLDWDKPLSQQAPEVQNALKAAATEAEKVKAAQFAKETDSWERGKLAEQLHRMTQIKELYPSLKGENAYLSLSSSGGTGTPVTAADWLKQQGIPGIRYLDGGSRGTGQGTSNFVVFPGNESLLTILERNGQSLFGP